MRIGNVESGERVIAVVDIGALYEIIGQGVRKSFEIALYLRGLDFHLRCGCTAGKSRKRTGNKGNHHRGTQPRGAFRIQALHRYHSSHDVTQAPWAFIQPLEVTRAEPPFASALPYTRPPAGTSDWPSEFKLSKRGTAVRTPESSINAPITGREVLRIGHAAVERLRARKTRLDLPFARFCIEVSPQARDRVFGSDHPVASTTDAAPQVDERRPLRVLRRRVLHERARLVDKAIRLVPSVPP